MANDMKSRRGIYLYTFLGVYAIALTIRILLHSDEPVYYNILNAVILAAAFVGMQYYYASKKKRGADRDTK